MGIKKNIDGVFAYGNQKTTKKSQVDPNIFLTGIFINMKFSTRLAAPSDPMMRIFYCFDENDC